MTFHVVAVDGPAVSGKSSAAKSLAKKLGWLYLDSGAVYRSITLSVLAGFKLDEPDLHARLTALDIRLVPHKEGLGCSVHKGNIDISDAIRTQEVSDTILPISGNPEVREWVTNFLRTQAGENNVVMDGRDIASVVFPLADYKFFVTASLVSRTKRRLSDLEGKEENYSYDEIYTMLEKRDAGDRSRSVGPLIQVEDAILIDNSKLNLEETVDKMYQKITHR